MDRGAWRATVHGVTKTTEELSACMHTHPQTTPHPHAQGSILQLITLLTDWLCSWFLTPQYGPLGHGGLWVLPGWPVIPWVCMLLIHYCQGLPWWPGCKESACTAGNARDAGSTPGAGRSPGGGHGNPLQCSCLENPMDRGAWRATVHGVTKGRTQEMRQSAHAGLLLLGSFSCFAANLIILKQKVWQASLLRASHPYSSPELSLESSARKKTSNGNRPSYKSAKEIHVRSQGSLNTWGNQEHKSEKWRQVNKKAGAAEMEFT